MTGQASAQKGSAMIGVLLVAILLVALFLVFSSWTTMGTKVVMHSLETQKAVYVAESGYYAALNWLKTPAAVSLTTNTLTMGSLTVGATYYLSMQLSQTDSSLVNIVSTGYTEVPTGHFLDPLGSKAEMGIIDAQVRVAGVKDYFAAVPGTLAIANGSDLTNSRVYGKDLIFMPPGPSTYTLVGQAYYFNSVTDGVNPNPAPSFVTFTGGPPNNAQKLPTEPRLPQVTPMRDSYYSMAADPSGPCILPVVGNNCTLSGSWTAPSPLNTSNVCFCQGNLYLGAPGQPLTVSGDVVVFVEGSTYIENNITPVVPGTDWMAIASEGDVIIPGSGDPQPPAPDVLTINGTFITDGAFNAGGSPRPAGQLTFNGGVVSQKNIWLSPYQLSRTYAYKVPNSALKLPFLVQSISWTIRHGKSL
jgi:hypothetical protein